MVGEDTTMDGGCELEGPDSADSEVSTCPRYGVRAEHSYVHEWRASFVSVEDTGGRRLARDVAEYIRSE